MVRLWDVEGKSELAQFQHNRYVHRVASTADGRAVLSVGERCVVKMWDLGRERLAGGYHDFRLYEGANIAGATGLSATHRATLLGFGTVESGCILAMATICL